MENLSDILQGGGRCDRSQGRVGESMVQVFVDNDNKTSLK